MAWMGRHSGSKSDLDVIKTLPESSLEHDQVHYSFMDEASIKVN